VAVRDRDEVAEGVSRAAGHAGETLPLPSVISWLKHRLGRDLTAYMGGLAVREQVWESREPERYAAIDFRLRVAYEITTILVEAYDAHTARAWLLGSNRTFDDQAPAWLLRNADEPEEVLDLIAAARDFGGSL
jgi:hypothetical protein